MLPILYTDAFFTVVNKPCGMLVHRTSIADEDQPVALQLLREQLGRMVYPVFRIDRPTSGIVVFAHSPEMTKLLHDEFEKESSQKIYTALVRGWLNQPFTSNREVKNDRGVLKEAETRFFPLEHFELNVPTDRYANARYCIVQAELITGRWHQIRQHLAQLRHYIINDRVHGDGKQNRIFTEQLGIRKMFLHATKISFLHPMKNTFIDISAPFPEHWEKFYEIGKSCF
jgi:tRNA pseudouridine65 synthase